MALMPPRPISKKTRKMSDFWKTQHVSPHEDRRVAIQVGWVRFGWDGNGMGGMAFLRLRGKAGSGRMGTDGRPGGRIHRTRKNTRETT